jgi:hypothetical protein
MQGYSGFEPEIGEIRALRSFRIGPEGFLHPLFGKDAWTDGTNTARCTARRGTFAAPGPPHHAPEPDCTCGFYAYASHAGLAEQPHARNVLAVVACWGRVIAGTRGIRAEHSRIEAIWMSAAVPSELAAMVRERYRSAQFYTDRMRMLTERPPTQLDCYELDEPGQSVRAAPPLRIATLLALVVASLPAAWLTSTHHEYLIWAADLWLVLVCATALRRSHTKAEAKRVALIALGVLLWIAAPIAGPAGLILLRLPLAQIAAALYLQRKLLERAAGRFPAEIG